MRAIYVGRLTQSLFFFVFGLSFVSFPEQILGLEVLGLELPPEKGVHVCMCVSA